jgi:hypothetical protein
MRIAITEKDAISIRAGLANKGVRQSDIDNLMKKGYEIYKSQQEIDAAIANKNKPKPVNFKTQMGLWTAFKFKYGLDKIDRFKYESFCAGWLQFYDIINRSATVEHTVYFRWNVNNKNDLAFGVEVYLSPPSKDPIGLFPKVKLLKPQDLVTYGFTKDPPSPTPPPPPL